VTTPEDCRAAWAHRPDERCPECGTGGDGPAPPTVSRGAPYEQWPECSRCGKKAPALTRRGLCGPCALADPTTPKIHGRGNREGHQSLTIEWGSEPFDGRDYGRLVQLIERVPHKSNRPGRPRELRWEDVCAAYEALRSAGEKGTQEEVAYLVGFSEKTVQAHAGEHGGWPPSL
jgi:hypothetical protein